MRTAKTHITCLSAQSDHGRSAKKVIAYYKMYEGRAKAQMIQYVKDDLSQRILRIFEGTFSLDAAHSIVVNNKNRILRPRRYCKTVASKRKQPTNICKICEFVPSCTCAKSHPGISQH